MTARVHVARSFDLDALLTVLAAAALDLPVTPCGSPAGMPIEEPVGRA